MIYVALLRGINVGGNNIIDMKLLKKAFEQVGMRAVKTYINTGNIIFETDQTSKKQIVHILEEAISTHFELQIKVLLRDLNEMKNVFASIPATWTNDSTMKSDVLFLWEDYDHESVLEQLTRKPVDTVLYVPGAILWSVAKEHVTKSGMQKLIGTALYKHMTVRNVNTTRKIAALMIEQSTSHNE